MHYLYTLHTKKWGWKTWQKKRSKSSPWLPAPPPPFSPSFLFPGTNVGLNPLLPFFPSFLPSFHTSQRKRGRKEWCCCRRLSWAGLGWAGQGQEPRARAFRMKEREKERPLPRITDRRRRGDVYLLLYVCGRTMMVMRKKQLIEEGKCLLYSTCNFFYFMK